MRRKWRSVILSVLVFATLAIAYVWTHPLVFMSVHRHCITNAGVQLDVYASDHDGRFPYDPKGYGNALLLMDDDYFETLTGPGYDASPFRRAKQTGEDLPEDECGRVYIQGLRKAGNLDIALLFDKLPTPGGDHCGLPRRLWAPLGREVWFVGGHQEFVKETEWPAFSARQVDLLVTGGFNRQEAERLFASRPK
jgi:hypothetical protein